MLTIIAQYKTKHDKGGEVAAALAKHVAATREEPGCREFVAYRSRSDGERFLLYEQYDDDKAFEAHRASPHFEQYVQGVIDPLLKERTFDIYDEVSAETE